LDDGIRATNTLFHFNGNKCAVQGARTAFHAGVVIFDPRFAIF
jgi:hypothetical protein